MKTKSSWAGRLLNEGRGRMRIEQLMTKVTRTCRAGHGLSEAAQMMWDEDCGCLPVTADDGSQRVVGMITDRDICMAACFTGRALNDIQVADAMTRDVCACNPGDDIAEARSIMREAALRRLPVVDGSGRVIGLLSLADFAREAIRERGVTNRNVTVGEVCLTLATICEPHQGAGLTHEAAAARASGSSPGGQAQPR